MSEKITEKCPQGTANYPSMHLWTMAFVALPTMEMSGGGPGNGNSQLPSIPGILGGLGIPNLPNIPGIPQMPGSAGQSQSGQAGSDQSQDNGPTFLAKEWAVRNGEPFVQKQWQTSVNMETSGTEDGSFKLCHKPQ